MIVNVPRGADRDTRWKVSSQWWPKTGPCSLSKEHLFKWWGDLKYEVQMLKKKKKKEIWLI